MEGIGFVVDRFKSGGNVNGEIALTELVYLSDLKPRPAVTLRLALVGGSAGFNISPTQGLRVYYTI